MLLGFAKRDITPRVGVGLYGYGPFLNRFSVGVRAPLYAGAVAASDGTETVILVSCDLVGLSVERADRVRQLVATRTGVPRSHICVHCTHTHSGPATKFGIGQGIEDPPYLEVLPARIAAACIEAFGNMAQATLSHTVVPCVGIGYNREDEARPSPEEALKEDWRPKLPHRTDTEAHVLRADAKGRMTGFATYFSCHPVVGSAAGRYIHGDFVGVATAALEREHPGSVGLFLQGCEGNTNSCAVHYDEQESLRALDIIAARFARQVRPGLRETSVLPKDRVSAVSRRVPITRAPLSEDTLRNMLAEREALLASHAANDADAEVRRATVHALAIRKELTRQASGEPFDETVEVQGIRMGDLVIVGAPFEIMIRYKQRIQEACPGPTLVLSLCNGAVSYAPERASFDQAGNYGVQIVPYLVGTVPFAPSIEDELCDALVSACSSLRQ